MDLRTRYMHLDLASPLVAGASPLSDDLGVVRELEDRGASAIVLASLFEEHVREAELRHKSRHSSNPPAIHFAAAREAALRTPDAYLEHVRRVKAAVSVPVIASLNGHTEGGWVELAAAIASAGADALELSVYLVPTELDETAAAIEDRVVEIVRAVRREIVLPLAVKLTPFYTNVANIARRLDLAGADALVLFNGQFQPDVDPDGGTWLPTLELSTSAELRLRLQWTAVLAGRVRPSLAVSGGVHTDRDVVKALLAGASVTQLVSAILERGPAHLTVVRDGVVAWMEAHGHASLDAVRGALSLARTPNREALARAGYLEVLHGRA